MLNSDLHFTPVVGGYLCPGTRLLPGGHSGRARAGHLPTSAPAPSFSQHLEAAWALSTSPSRLDSAQSGVDTLPRPAAPLPSCKAAPCVNTAVPVLHAPPHHPRNSYAPTVWARKENNSLKVSFSSSIYGFFSNSKSNA